MGYISLRNPKTDIKELLNVLSIVNQYTLNTGKDTFTYEEVSEVTTSEGTITSKGNFGAKAILASENKDKSKDSIKMQLKSLSEVFRILGWIIQGDNSHSFILTEFGKELVTEYEKYPQSNHYLDDLIIPFLLINYKHPQIDTNSTFNFFPYLTTLNIANKLNYITKWEIIHFINNSTAKSENDIIQNILKARKEKGFYTDHVKKELTTAKINETTADNYNKLPMAFFLKLGLLEKKSLKDLKVNLTNLLINGQEERGKTEVLVLTEKAINFLNTLKNVKILSYKDLEKEEKKKTAGIICSLNLLNIEGIKQRKIFNNYIVFPYHALNSNEIKKFDLFIKKLKKKKNINNIFLTNTVNIEYSIYDTNALKHIDISLESPAIETSSRVESACLECKPAPCYEYKKEELQLSNLDNNAIPDLSPYSVCPTNAIEINTTASLSINYSNCIDCLICISRCPYGAIYYKDEKLILDTNTSEKFLNKTTENREKAITHFNQLKIKATYQKSSDEFLLKILNNFYTKSLTLKQDSFYPLVRNLLRSLGIKTKIGKAGDTAWRYDAIVLEPFVMPIEIKSPTEDQKINPNSVRQAIENAINVEAQHNLAKKAKSAVVGVHYSNERSASKDMLSNANELHNIKILLISSIILMYLNMKKLYNNIIIDDLIFLFENTIGPLDVEAIKEFWLNYLVRREEVEVLGEKAKYSHTLSYDKNDFKTKLSEEVEFFEKVFDLIKVQK